MRGRLVNIRRDYKDAKPVISFEVEESIDHLEDLFGRLVDIKVDVHRDKRSRSANAFLWTCLGELAKAMQTDDWSMYLYELERYGKFEAVLIKPEAVTAMKKMWRACKEIGRIKTVYEHMENGRIVTVHESMVEMLCFYGSSTYNSAEMARLIDGVISDMKEMHLKTPPSVEMKALLEKMDGQDKESVAR